MAYADDITLISKNPNPIQAVKDLQAMCDKIINWLAIRKREISAIKSSLMIFSRHPTVITAAATLRLHLCGIDLGPTDQTRFLGFQLDNITALCLIAKKQIFSCKRFLGLTWRVNSNRLKTTTWLSNQVFSTAARSGTPNRDTRKLLRCCGLCSDCSTS